MPEDQENQHRKDNRLRRFLDRLRGGDMDQAERWQAEERIAEFLDEKDGDDWRPLRKYERVNTGFRWWEDPLAEGAVIERQHFNTPNWEKGGSKNRPLSTFFVVGKRSADSPYPPVYQFEVFGSEHSRIAGLGRKDIRDTVKKEILVMRFSRDDKQQAEGLMQCEDDKTRQTRVHSTVRVWFKGKPETTRRKSSSKADLIHTNLIPSPIPIPAR